MKIKSICSHCVKDHFCKEPCSFLIKLKKDAEGVCIDCHFYGECKRLCFLAKAFTNGSSRPLHEIGRKHKGQEIRIIHSEKEYKVKNFSHFPMVKEDGEEHSVINDISEKQVNDFWEGITYQGSSLKLCIFIDKFFNKMDEEEIAIKYNIDVHAVMKNYQKAKKTIFEVINDMNNYRAELAKRKVSEGNTNQMNQLPNGVKAFLLRYVFDLNNMDISKILGITTSNVSASLLPLRADVEAGINIIKFDKDLKPVPISKLEKALDRKQALQVEK